MHDIRYRLRVKFQHEMPKKYVASVTIPCEEEKISKDTKKVCDEFYYFFGRKI